MPPVGLSCLRANGREDAAVNSLWLVITALAAFLVAYRFYGAFLAARVAVLNDAAITPAHRLRDNVDYHPTRRLVLFGVHFAAIAGPGPLVGPVLASQWGYFPGFAWIVVGACLAGGVHDFVVLLASVRHDGLSLPKIARNLLGPVSGVTTTLATLFIVIATLAGVGMVVVNALSESPWGMFTIVVTIPAALLTGLWMNKIRPGRVGEASLIGVDAGAAGRDSGQAVRRLVALVPTCCFSKPQLSIILPAYAAIASILPVWVLLCPRGYFSSYMKIGVIAVLAVGIFVAHPVLKMPATTPFIPGGGPVVPGSGLAVRVHRDHVRGAVGVPCPGRLGHHAEDDQPGVRHPADRLRRRCCWKVSCPITALVAACALEPGDYFKINTEAEQIRSRRATAAKPGRRPGLAPKEFDRLEGQHRRRSIWPAGPAGRSPWPWAWPRCFPACPA